MKLAILGTGLVASSLLEYLKSDDVDIYSSRKENNYKSYDELINNKYDVVFGCLNLEKTKEIYPLLQTKLFIDNSELFRLNPLTPLIIANTNENQLTKDTTIASNPNCVTIMVGSFLIPLSKSFPLKKIILTSMQSVSGMGQNALSRFLNERSDYEYLDKKVNPRFTLNDELTQVLDNIIPLVGELEDNGLSHEENKIRLELEKLIKGAEVCPMCYRVPLTFGHTASLHITLDEYFDKLKIIRMIETKTNIIYNETIDLIKAVKDKEHIYATRLRLDPYCPYAFNITLMSNNTTIGASYNSFKIYEKYKEINNLL